MKVNAVTTRQSGGVTVGTSFQGMSQGDTTNLFFTYEPPDTIAAARGARTLGGLGMLVYQAAAAFEAWTDQTAPVEVMRQAAERELAMRN